MSDPTLDEDSLISQDDIDKLLESSSIEEVEEKLSADEPGPDEDDFDEDELGEISQDDIDKLLSASSQEPDDTAKDDDPEEEVSDAAAQAAPEVPEASDASEDQGPEAEDDMELISQDDIDKLMNSGAGDDISRDPDAEPNDASGDEFGELSQDDIDSLVGGNSDASDPAADETGDEDMEMISQDDIDSLMGSGTEDVDEPEPKEDSQKEDLAPDEETPENIETVQPEAPEAPEVSARADDVGEDPYLIKEEDALDIQDCLVTQDVLDDLLKNFKPASPAETVILDDEAPVEGSVDSDAPEEDTAVILDSVSDPEPVLETGDTEEPAESAVEEEDDIFKPDSDEAMLDFEEKDEDVTQEDIDALLLESDDDEDDDEDDDVLISQDDIDTLLMAADQEDEDVLGGLMDEDLDESDDEDLFGEDENILDTDDFDDDEDAFDEDQVVLEGDDDEIGEAPLKPAAVEKSAWYRSKLVVACASALIVLGITVPAVYFMFFSGSEKVPTDPVPLIAMQPEREIDVETVDVQVKAEPVIRKSGSMVLPDFVVMASDLSKDIVYVTADVAIDYSDQRAYHEIQSNLSFYRDLIYDSINKSLASEKISDVTEEDILWGLETALKKVLPGAYIDRVSFKSFKVS